MQNSVFAPELVAQVVKELNIVNLEQATIGQVVLLASRLEVLTGIPFIRMDQGVPGLPPCRIGLEAEKMALEQGVAAIYPAAEGIPPLKAEASRFVKAFLDIDIAPAGCIPVTGSVAGSFGAFIACSQLHAERKTILFLDPGFPIQKSQLSIIGVSYEQFDIYAFRGQKLREKLESYLAQGNITAIVYSNPNNPAWTCLEEEELQIIGELATKYDVIVLEDLAYFAMDFRKELSRPFNPPFQATVACYTQNYMLFLSASKIFSYAGQRMAVVCLSDGLFERRYAALAERYKGAGLLGSTFINSILYMITSGATHTTQYGLAAMFQAASDGTHNFVAETRAYERRAKRMKKIFVDNGFRVVYDRDVTQEVGDGFFFTIGYGEMPCGELMRDLLYYGVSSIALSTTGSEQQGIRACTSRMSEELYEVLNQRLTAFHTDH